MVALPAGSAPNVLNKSFSITADVETQAAATSDGAIFSIGGSDGGYGLYVRDGTPVFAGNFLGRTTTRVDVERRRCRRARRSCAASSRTTAAAWARAAR